jgi:hypothetical protein
MRVKPNTTSAIKAKDGPRISNDLACNFKMQCLHKKRFNLWVSPFSDPQVGEQLSVAKKALPPIWWGGQLRDIYIF